MRLTLQALIDAGACKAGLKSFRERIGSDDGYEWTAEEAGRVFRKDPRFLRWLEQKGLVPVLDVAGLPPVERREQKAQDKMAKAAARALRVNR